MIIEERNSVKGGSTKFIKLLSLHFNVNITACHVEVRFET